MRAAALKVDFFSEKTKKKIHLPITIFKRPENDKEYAALEKCLHLLLDEVGDDESHPLQIVLQIIGENLELYDDIHHPAIGQHVSHIEMVKYLMESNGLYQKDLADIFGSQANVSKFLNGERELSKNNIIGLKKKFGISADFFLNN